ncbi:9453_t:CDS:2, partial [Gigaspora margarita]
DIQEINDVSFAISNASKEVEQLSNNLYDDDNFLSDNIFQNGQRQVDQILDSDSSNTFHPNKASPLVAYFTKNENPEQ